MVVQNGSKTFIDLWNFLIYMRTVPRVVNSVYTFINVLMGRISSLYQTKKKHIRPHFFHTGLLTHQSACKKEKKKQSKKCVVVYLWVGQAGVVGFQVVDDALAGTGQRDPTHQQHHQHDVGEGGRQVHHLEGGEGDGGGTQPISG